MVILRGKCIVVGDSTVGKSSILQAFSSDGSAFPKNYMMSTNVDVISKFLRFGKNNKDIVDLFLFDTPGQLAFKKLSEIHFNDLAMYVIVYDITNKESFNHCEQWLQVLKKFMSVDKTIPGVMIGNKLDMDRRRVVEANDAKKLASKYGMEYFECSAKKYENVEAPFRWLAENFHTLHSEAPELIQQMT